MTWCDLSAFARLQLYSVTVNGFLNIISFNLPSVRDVTPLIEAPIEAVQSGYVRQIGVKHKGVIHIPADNDDLYPSAFKSVQSNQIKRRPQDKLCSLDTQK